MSGLATSWASSIPVIHLRVHQGRAQRIRTCCPLVSRNYNGRRRKLLHSGSWKNRSRNIVFSSSEDPSNITEAFDKLESKENELTEIRKDIAEAKSMLKSIDKERGQLLKGLFVAETKQKEYVATITHDKELAIGELEAAKSLFHDKLQQSVEEKLALESKLVLAKEDAVEIAVKVEKLVEIAFQQATSHAIEDALLRMSAAETSAADAAYHIEEQITNASEGTILSIVDHAKDAIEKALTVAEKTGDQVRKAVTVFDSGVDIGDDIVALQEENIKLLGIVNDLQYQIQLIKSEVARLKLELEQASAQVKTSVLRAEDAEKTLNEFHESSRERTTKEEEKVKSLLEKLKNDAAERISTASTAFKAELERINTTIEAAREAASSKHKAEKRRFDALQRSLRASEDASKMWRQRMEMAEVMLRKRSTLNEANEDVLYMVNGGRIDNLKQDDSQKLKLLTNGPRRDIPQWMARRIRTFLTKFPPRKTDVSEALQSKSRTLELPKVDEVWSIAQEKPKQGDTLIEHVIEKEIIEKKRKALEHALQRKAIQWQRTPEQTKLEPGTGTGYEIVFQGFNWESCRRKWYMEMATKAADLSQSGITAVWLPPPTQSVAPQGYMPSDLYNLNSAYGSVEDLKDCIKEMHSQDLLVLGDVVLNHRCAQKQGPNGVWNIYGGKLAWGPEAIVCDDPNFQGRGNPSSGDIFHAAPNVDHSQEFVRKDIKEWLNWLRNEIGFDGWRLDFVRGFSGTYVKEYIEASSPAFSIGEYWDSLAYEHGNLCYNQDAHRQRIINWINATGGTSSAFDVTTKGILHSALHNQYWRLIDPQGKPTGVMGWWASRAVTFLENHDTGSTQGHWPFPRDKLMQGYAYILTHPGTPVVFYDHFYDFGIRDPINELIEARRRAGVNCRSHVKIYHANNDGYVAQVGDMLVMKIGHFDWNPSKENQLEGSWQKFVDKGGDYQVWIRQ